MKKIDIRTASQAATRLLRYLGAAIGSLSNKSHREFYLGGTMPLIELACRVKEGEFLAQVRDNAPYAYMRFLASRVLDATSMPRSSMVAIFKKAASPLESIRLLAFELREADDSRKEYEEMRSRLIGQINAAIRDLESLGSLEYADMFLEIAEISGDRLFLETARVFAENLIGDNLTVAEIYMHIARATGSVDDVKKSLENLQLSNKKAFNYDYDRLQYIVDGLSGIPNGDALRTIRSHITVSNCEISLDSLMYMAIAGVEDCSFTIANSLYRDAPIHYRVILGTYLFRATKLEKYLEAGDAWRIRRARQSMLGYKRSDLDDTLEIHVIAQSLLACEDEIEAIDNDDFDTLSPRGQIKVLMLASEKGVVSKMTYLARGIADGCSGREAAILQARIYERTQDPIDLVLSLDAYERFVAEGGENDIEYLLGLAGSFLESGLA